MLFRLKVSFSTPSPRASSFAHRHISTPPLLISQEVKDIWTHVIEKNRYLAQIRTIESSKEAELPLRANFTSTNGTSSDTLRNPTNLGLGRLSLELNQRVGI